MEESRLLALTLGHSAIVGNAVVYHNLNTIL